MLADLLPRRHDPEPSFGRSSRRSIEPDSDIEVTPEIQRRFDRLRSLRLQMARERSLPPYIICHDKTLKQIAIEAPLDIAGLENIRGMGTYKIKLYGQAFLDAVKDA